MLKQLHIRNFRGFRDLTIDALSDINLIAGSNNSGKTSLLEAIFLLSGKGNPQMAINANVVRGLERSNMPATTVETFWKQLFFDLNMERSVEIQGDHTEYGQLTLKIAPERQSIANVPLNRAGGVLATNRIDDRSLVFQYSDPSGDPVESRISVKGESFELNHPPTIVRFPSTICLSRNRNIHEDAVRLGDLRKKKRGDVALKALQVIEPKLKGIEENSSSGWSMIWGDIGLSELVPLATMGEGMTQIARLVLAMSSTPNGVVLFDEIENGLHHSVLPNIWRVVDETARQFHVQVFATTHSYECIEAAHKSLNADRFFLHRLEADDEENRCITIKPNGIRALIQHNLEVR